MRKNIILIIILFILAWIYFWINYLNDTSREKNNMSNIDISFNDFSYNKIKSKNIEIDNGKIIYSWTWKFKQDDEKVKNFIEEIKNTKIVSLVSTNKKNFDNFWVNNSWSILIIWNSKIFLWNTKLQEQYIRIDWLDKVFLIDKDLTSFLNKDYNYFKKEEETNIWTWETNTITWSEK